jgi:hypothetical protein
MTGEAGAWNIKRSWRGGLFPGASAEVGMHYSVNRWRWTRPLLSQTSNRYAVPRVSENVGAFGTVA